MDSVNQKFCDKLSDLEVRFNELTSFLESVEVMSDNKLYNHYLKERKDIESVVLGYKKYKSLEQEVLDNLELLKIESDEGTKQILIKQNESLTDQKDELFAELKAKYLENKNKATQKVRVEINSKESIEFVFNIIKAFVENKSAELNIEKQTDNSLICNIFGENLYDELSSLCGNVKIIKNTKEQDAKIVVLDEKIYNTEINLDDIEIKTSKSSGAGGQHINKTESAVKLIHIPTGISVECQDERSQTKNKERALELLKNKILQNYEKNNENYIKNQRNNIKNAIFSNSNAVIFDLDKHRVVVNTIKKEYNISEILSGNLEVISNDLRV